MRIGSLFGIEITINVTWIFVFAFVAWALANPVGPLRLSGVGPLERVAFGLMGAALFFASVLVHELAHSLLARKRGIRVRGITLFIFGGVSQFEGEAHDAPGEAWISAIGPLTSLALGLIFYGLAVAAGVSTHFGTMFAYLSAANVILAFFNFVPAYPLDGGRVLHALLWKLTGNRQRATSVTVAVGRVLAGLMIAFGIWQALTRDPFGGLWLTFIGWFLIQAGNAEQTRSTLSGALRGHVAADFAESSRAGLPADSTAAGALQAMLRERTRTSPVYLGEQLLGVVSVEDLTAMSEQERNGSYVTALMTRTDALPSAAADTPASELMPMLAGGVRAIALTGPGGDVEGIVTRESVLRSLGATAA